ncbi:MAG TPA: exodeoxyribonuclease III [Methylocella sp.]|nr:exodeoxyribonuclease III [Methylocella sp.]
MRLTLATWNINSVRLRINLVARFLAEAAPDILCLQETKCRDSEFPTAAFRELGYSQLAINGQKGYHGVAIAAKIPFQILAKHPFCEKGDARHIAVAVDAGPGRRIAIHNFYVPAGGDEPDPALNPKFAHKLAFLDAMTQWTKVSKIGEGDSVLVGDLNIAPLETDVWNHKALLSVVSHTPVEVDKLTLLQRAGPWVDVLRQFIPPEERLYTWWSYRAREWEKSDRGRRLDHIWVSRSLKPHLDQARVLRESRNWERPSDHVPVLAEFKF